MIKKIPFIKILLFMVLPAINSNAQFVEVTIKGIRSEKGQIALGVFKDDETFQKEEAFLNRKFEKKGISNGEMTVWFSIDENQTRRITIRIRYM